VRFEEGDEIDIPGVGTRQTIHTEWEVVGVFDDEPTEHLEGQVLYIPFQVKGPRAAYSKKDMGSCVVALMGFNTVAEYRELDPKGAIVDATIGAMVPPEFEGITLVGRIADVRSTKGKAVLHEGVPTGRNYTNMRWEPVPEDQQPEA